jgi:hypothetical protein
VHGHTAPRRVLGSLDGPSRTFTVEPLQVPATAPAPPMIEPSPAPERTEPSPERTEPAPTP